MIAVLTNAGSLQFSRTLSGGERFLVYGAALVDAAINDPYKAATGIPSVVFDASGKETSISGLGNVVKVVPCTGILPVQVSEGASTAVAVDFDFNTQLATTNPATKKLVSDPVTYRSVCMLGRRYSLIRNIERGATYKQGDHVWFGDNRDTLYTCIPAEYVYGPDSQSPDIDTENWLASSAANLLRHPADQAYCADPRQDAIVMHVTSYDEYMTMGNGLEFEYKVRVFLDNLLQSDLQSIEKFAEGTEANGSLILSFMATISEDFRLLRNSISTYLN